MSSKRAQERALTLQDREVHRFYQPWLDAHGSSARMTAHVSDLADTPNLAPETLEEKGHTAKSSRDKALTAFAQLATLRLNVRRAIVSLIDSSHQYVLAEATKTLSLVDNSRHAEDDGLWLGSSVLSREDAICQCAFTRTYTVTDDDGKIVSGKGAVMPDCKLDSALKDRPYVVAHPGVRFYAGVPIKSRSGHLIGVYAVSGDKPRDALTADEFRFMQDIATAIMDHLEWARDRVDRYKGERIVRGMAEFVDGSSTIRSAETELQKDPMSSASPVANNAPHTANDASDDSDAAAATDDKHTSTSKTKSSSASKRSSHEKHSSTPVSYTPKKPTKSDSLSKVLDRAASILRRSTLAAGVVFYGPTGGAQSGPSLTPQHPDGEVTTDDEKVQRQSASHVDIANDSSDSDSLNHTGIAQVLGLSLTNKEEQSIFHDTAIGVRTLEFYFRLYPHGKSMHFSDQGSGLSSEDDSASEGQKDVSNINVTSNADKAAEEVGTRKKKKRIDHQELLKILPGVKNIIFLPLWDYIEHKIIAGCFIWTSNTGRMMSVDDDLSFLRAFSNTIMSEIVRINAKKNDRAKTTFIASMSHELRSPLHGILGSVEFLQDTATDSYQAGLITSISTCGKTLLDTLDHVLDYAKINKLGGLKSRKIARADRPKQASSDSATDSINISTEIDLGLIVEEVVEAVCAGHAFKQMHTADLDSRRTPAIKLIRAEATQVGPANGSNINNGEVAVLLDVSPRASWWVRTQPGALRRIIMNLFGNALKYTASGFVAVSLRAQESETPNKLDAVFRVVDSGKGMSEEFQKNRLFVPFSQEDSFQPGTGLGLSIVRQIVDSLGGTITVKSLQGVGTEVDVCLTLTAAEKSFDVAGEITAIAAKTRGLRLCLLDPAYEKQKPSNDHIARLDTTLRETCYFWFEMEVMKASSMHGTSADIFMYTEPPSVEYLLEHHGVDKTKEKSEQADSGREVPLIIVCLNASEAIGISANHIKKLSALGRIVEVVSQPCGPRKLAKVLDICVRRMKESLGKSMQKEQDNRTARAPVEDQGSAIALGLASTSLPRLASAEAIRTRAYLKELSSQIPPSPAVAFPTATSADKDTTSLETLSYRNGPPKDKAGNDDVPHVLLVDDNRINLQLLVMFSKKHKLSYVEAENGQEALDAYITSCDNQRAGGRRFDFVLMDISMPIMDGMEATRRIRQYEHENGLKRATIIALTGLASAQAQEEAELSGIDVYMPKPVKFQELRPLLARRSGSASKESKKSSKKDDNTKERDASEEIKSAKGDESAKEHQAIKEVKVPSKDKPRPENGNSRDQPCALEDPSTDQSTKEVPSTNGRSTRDEAAKEAFTEDNKPSKEDKPISEDK